MRMTFLINTCNVSVDLSVEEEFIYQPYGGTHTPPFWNGGYCTPHIHIFANFWSVVYRDCRKDRLYYILDLTAKMHQI